MTANYPGIVIEADDNAIQLWGAVYYRDPETGLLVRYIGPRVVEHQRVKWNVPVRKDGLERVVVIAEQEDDLDNELPGKPEKESKVRYIPLKDPEGQESEGQENEIRLEDLSNKDIKSLEKAKEQMRKKLKEDDVKGALQEKARKQEA